MARGQFDIDLRDQIDKRPLAGRGGQMHGLDHVFVLVCAGDREDLREPRPDHIGFLAHAAGHDHAAILGNRFTDRFEAFLFGRIEETARIDQHHVGPGIIGAHRIAIGAKRGEDAFGIDQRLGTAEADHADALLVGNKTCHDARPYT